MRSDTESAPIAFAQQFLLLGGAAVEENGSSIEALIPENLRTMLHVPEHIRIFGDYGSTAGRSGQYVVSYGTPLLENMIREALEKVPLAACRLDFDYVKSGGFQRLLKEQVTFYGAVASIEAIAEVIKDYFLVAFRYSARSDEQKEGLLTAAFQADTGDFVPDMAEALDGAACGRAYFTPPESAPESLAGLATSVERTARRILRDQLEPFRQTMDRRLKRDIANLSEYYRSLDQEMRKSLEKPGLSENAQSDRQSKIDAIPSELASKTDDLLKKYSIKVGLQPAAVMQVRTPAKKIACSMAVGRRNRQFFLTYNPVTRCIDPPACSSCGKIISHIHFNGELKPVCFECK
jgi:hypothetical protein